MPRDPTVHLIWQDADVGVHRDALERLATKVTHVGHSASFVQAWLEPNSLVGMQTLLAPIKPGSTDTRGAPSALMSCACE